MIYRDNGKNNEEGSIERRAIVIGSLSLSLSLSLHKVHHATGERERGRERDVG